MYNINEIDNLIINFKNNNNKNTYDIIKEWYNNNKDNNNEYLNKKLSCIYIFLLGANIKNRFYSFTYEEHLKYIKIIREHIEDSTLNNLERLTIKTYLEYGTKSK